MKYFSKIRLAWFFVILLSAVNITLFLIYFTGFHHRHDGGHRRPGEKEGAGEKQECMLRSELKLDDAQTAKYDQIRKNHHEKAHQVVDSLRNVRMLLMTELKKEVLNRPLVDSLMLQVDGFSNRLFGLSIEQYLEIKSMLKPDQKERLFKVYSDMFGHSSRRSHHDGQGEGKSSCGSSKKCE